MQKEIFEQPESVVNTMRGRVNFENNTGDVSCTQISKSFTDISKASREFTVLVNLSLLLHLSEENLFNGNVVCLCKHLPADTLHLLYVLTLVELNGQSTASLSIKLDS